MNGLNKTLINHLLGLVYLFIYKIPGLAEDNTLG